MSSLMESRREARRRKILENSAKRMNAILDVEEKREPGLEDGPAPTFKMAENFKPAEVTTDHLNNHITSKPSGEDVVCDKDSAPSGRDDLASLPVHTWNDSAAPKGGASPYQDSAHTCVRSAEYKKERLWALLTCVSLDYKPRIVIALALGALSAVVVLLLDSTANLLVPWLSYELLMEALFYYVRHFVLRAPPYPSHGHLVNILLFAGVHPRVVRLAGRSSECFVRVINDTLAMICGFIGVLALSQVGA